MACYRPLGGTSRVANALYNLRHSNTPSALGEVLKNGVGGGFGYARGKFGGLALLVALFAGGMGLDEGDPGALAVAALSGFLAVMLIGMRGIMWAMAIGAILLALKLCSSA